MQSITASDAWRGAAILNIQAAAKPKLLQIQAATSGAIDQTTPAGPGDPSVQTPPKAPSPVDSLMADWGKSGTPNDLNGDGTVDVKDLLALLARLGSDTVSDPSAESGGAIETPAQGPSVDSILADWGQTESPSDLDGDGTVNVKDLLAMLTRVSQGGDQQDQQPQVPDATFIQKLLASWGQESAAFDINGDGTVGVQDLLAALAGATGDTQDSAPDQPSIQDLLAAWGRTDSTSDLNQDGTVNVQDLLKALAEIGQDRQPPPTGGQVRMRHHHAAAAHAESALWQRIGESDPGANLSVVG